MTSRRIGRFVVLSLQGLASVGLVAVLSSCGNSGGNQAVPELVSISPPSTTLPTPVQTVTSTSTVPTTIVTTTTTRTTTTTLPKVAVPASGVKRPWGSVVGVTMFRGNPTRSYYGAGPVPDRPEILWRYPDKAMCTSKAVDGETVTWCGTGWTGQPVIWDRPDGVTEVIFGAYDRQVHFLDAETGQPTRPAFRVGDIVKGSPTLDPDGYPLLYFGARDDLLRILALDREEPTELWARSAYENPVRWNNDWDSNPVIVEDVMYEGGENGWFFAFRLNRGYDKGGLVTVDPEALIEFQTWDDELLRQEGGDQVSVENSAAVFENRVFFANSAGRVLGLDISEVGRGEAPVVLDFRVGEDVDATIVVDEAGYLYVSAEQEIFSTRGKEVGQLMKLDPSRPDDPLVWSVAVPPRGGGNGGLWATPALGDGVLYAATHPGELLVVETDTGEVVWRDEIGPHAWSSPVLADRTLVVAIGCGIRGALRGYDVSDPKRPVALWESPLPSGACIESTPVVWRGGIFVGSRDGYFYAFGEPDG